MCTRQYQFEPTHVYANICPRLLNECNKEDNLANKDERRVEFTSVVISGQGKMDWTYLIIFKESKIPDTSAFFCVVSGTAEYYLPPDQAILTIIISHKKEKAEEARVSTTRRLDYVTQMLTNHGLQKCNVEVTKSMSRVSGGRGFFVMEAQVDAVFHNQLHKCLQLQNLFVEKLDKSVRILPVTLRHDKQNMEAIRKKTCVAALSNARQKALEVCRLMGQYLGRPVFITENIIREWKGGYCEDSNASSQTAERPPASASNCPCFTELDIQKRMKEQSLTVKVDVTATFEICCKFRKEKETKVLTSPVCRRAKKKCNR